MPLSDGLIFRGTKILAVLLLIGIKTGYCQKGILDSLFTFNEGTVRTDYALEIITNRSGYYFTYDSRLVNPGNRIELIFNNEKLDNILKNFLGKDSIALTVIDKYIIISKSVPGNTEVSRADTLTAKVAEYISGIIVDEASDDPLPFATISLKNKGRGTVSNINGEFRLSIPEDTRSDILSITYLGFIPGEIAVEQALGKPVTVALKRDYISIPEIIIRTQVPQEIILRSVSSIKNNFGNDPAMLTAFYREGVLKKRELQSYSEAVLQIYKSAYVNSLLNDQIKVLKSRKIDNIDAADTLAVRLKAGLSTCLELDGMKNLFDFMAHQSIDEYAYRITDIVTYDDEAAYVIEFEQREGIDLPLYRGTVYINTSDFAVLKADFELHPRYISKMKESFISNSARGFTTWPLTVKYSVTYRQVDNRYFLNHVRGDLVFTSKQNRKLFNSQFNVFFELAVTTINTTGVTRFEREEIAPLHSVFSKTITSYDPEFWGDQDFLKPEDNLLQALRNMKVRLQEFSDGEN